MSYANLYFVKEAQHSSKNLSRRYICRNISCFRFCLVGCSGVTIAKLNEHGNGCSRTSGTSTSVFMTYQRLVTKTWIYLTEILTNTNFFSC